MRWGTRFAEWLGIVKGIAARVSNFGAQ